MPEEHVSITGDVVDAVVQLVGRSDGVGVQLEDLATEVFGVDVVAEQVETETSKGRERRYHGRLLYVRVMKIRHPV